MDAARRTGKQTARALSEQVEAVLAACRVLVGISAQSMAEVGDTLSLPLFRVLVILDSRGPIGLQALAAAMGVHPSNATRACDRLVRMGFLDRRDNPEDRRYLALELTETGAELISTVMAKRRAAVREILEAMGPSDRECLADGLRMFAIAGREPDPAHLWALGWTSPAD